MSKASIPEDIKQQAIAIVEKFNRTTMHAPRDYYAVRFRGRFAYLDRCQGGQVGPRCRLEYGGGIAKWDFAIYKYSRNDYDPHEFMFPGSEHTDGTVEGALKAVQKAYP
jgi:hypothetical protein